MADSGTYDQATILRRQKIAEQMLAESSKPQPIRHWAQGLAQLGNVGADAFALNRLDKQANESRRSDTAALMAGLNLGGDTATPSAPATPPMSSAAPSPMPAAVAPDPTQPRGIRNNNPLNIEAGDFTKGQPGFSGSDGRFAKFATPEQGTDAASKLLDVYSNKHGLNTVAGIVNRWAPATDGNPSQAYAASVAGRMGVAPDAPLNMADPTVKQKIIAAMGQFENGKPIPGNMVAGAGAAPPAGPPSAPVGAPAAPAPSPAAASPSGPQAPGALPAPSGVAPSQKEAIARLLSSTPGSPAYQLGIQLAGQAVKPHDFTYQTLPDGTVLRMDPTGRTQPTPVYQAPVKPKFTQTGEGAFGDKQYGFVDENAKTVTPANAGAPGSATGLPGTDSGFMAKGVTAVDHNLKGQDYIDQFSPEVQSAVRNYVDGKSTPTGNPRKGFTQAVKMVAQKYGEDIGPPSDDTSFGARRTMRSQLSSGGAGTLGGQINFGNTAIGHLADLSQRALELDNSSGLGIAPLAHAVNTVRGLTTEQASKMQALQDAAQHYGQEITKFYAGSPGGEGERNRFMSAVSAAKSPAELAAVIQQEAELIPSRLSSVEGQIKTVLGPQGLKDYPVVRPESQKALERITANVERLRGGRAAEKPAEAPAGGGKVRTYNPETGKIE